MRIEPEIGSTSIVLLGSFNPTIISPAWMEKIGLVTSAEANAATLHMIHPELATFTLGSKNVQVEPNKFSVDSSEAPWVSILDIVLRLFGDYLPHTPVNRFGINRTVHFRVGTEEVRNRIGRRLAPLDVWGAWGAEIAESKFPTRGGFTSLTMFLPRSGDVKGHAQATVQPSVAIPGSAGVFVQVNEDFFSSAWKSEDGAIPAMTRLSQEFERSVAHAEWVIDQVMALSEAEKQGV